MKIHPTAIIDSTAKVHPSAEVGPYTIIEAGVEVGENCIIGSCVRIYANSKIGKNNKIFHNVVIGAEPQDLGYDPSAKTGIIIGNHNVFREGVHISRGTKSDTPTTIGDDNYFMGNFHAGHDCVIGNKNIFTQGAEIAGHVHVGNRVFVSGLVAVHQFCHIGDYAMVAGLSKVTKDVPPYCTVDGNPAFVIGLNSVGLRRAGLSSEIRNSIREAYKIIYHSDLFTSNALEELRKIEDLTEEVKYIISFFEKSERGVTDHR